MPQVGSELIISKSVSRPPGHRERKAQGAILTQRQLIPQSLRHRRSNDNHSGKSFSASRVGAL